MDEELRKSVDSNGITSYHCPDCNYSSYIISLMKDHIILHHPDKSAKKSSEVSVRICDPSRYYGENSPAELCEHYKDDGRCDSDAECSCKKETFMTEEKLGSNDNCPICGRPKNSPNYAYHICVPPRAEKLSERLHEWVGVVGARLELVDRLFLQKFGQEVETFEAERIQLLDRQNNLIAETWNLQGRMEALEAENQRLKEIKEEYCKVWLEEAEKVRRVKELPEKWRKYWDEARVYDICVDELEEVLK